MIEFFKVQGLQPAARQLAGAVARQGVDEDRRARQENGVDARAQCGEQLPAGQCRGDDEGGQPRDAVRGLVVGQEEGGSSTPARRRLVVQVGERGACRRC
jgi:hypothetical protein